MSGEEESFLEVSEPETQFVPQENDEEELWEVIEITAEKGRRYKVKWAGTDPKTHKPWPQSWVAKHDCTDDLVKTWKKAQALKKKEGAQRKSGKPISAVSKKSRSSGVRGSTASSSSTTKNTRSSDATPIAGPSNLNSNGKRKHSPLESAKSDNISNLSAVIEPPPRKKRKLEVEPVAEADLSDDDAIPARKAGRVGIPNAVSGQGKQKVSEVVELDETDEEDVGRREGRKGKVLRKNPLVDDRSSIVSGQSRASATKKVKNKTSASASRRSSTTQRAISPVPSVDHGSPTDRPEPLFLADPPEDLSPHSRQRPLSTSHQSSSPQVVRTSFPRDVEILVSPADDLSRLSPTGWAQLADFDAFMAKGGQEPTSVNPHEEVDINQMYDEYVDFNPLSEDEPSDPTKTRIKLSKTTISSPPTSPPRPRDKDTEPLATSNEEDSQPVTSPPPPFKARPVRAGNSRIPNVGSFRQGVVPETETESSTNNTQSQPKPLPQIIEPSAADPVTTTPVRASLIRRMRPRTPGSANGSKLSLIDEANTYDPLNHDYTDGDGTRPITSEDWPVLTKNITNLGGKSLRPIPILSPSKFTPHLPHSSISNQLTEEAEVEELMSSIEQFSSSEDEGSKLGARTKKKQRRDKGKRKQVELELEPEPEPEPEPESPVQAQDTSITEDEDIIEISIIERGQKMAEVARKERLAREKHLAGEGPSQKVSLVELLKANNKKRKRKGTSRDKKSLFEHRLGHRDSSHGIKPSTPEAKSRSATPDAAIEESVAGSEPGDTDADGEDEENDMVTMALREEEEENTQDIMADIANLRRGTDEVGVQMGWDPSGPAETEAELTQEVQQGPVVGPGLPEDGPEEDPEDPSPQSHKVSDDIIMETPSAVIPPRSRSRSLPRTRSVSPSPEPPKPGEDESQSILPPTASTRQSTPEINPEILSQDEPEHLGAAMALLNTKSQEIAKLDALLVTEQAKNEALFQELEALKAALTAATSGPQCEDTEPGLELSEARSLLVQERSAWDTERSKTAASIEALTREKAGAQADLEFFREQYARASGFVSSVRRENEELESRTRIAEEQTTVGVAMVKATFEKRLEKLEDDIKNWRRIAMFMMEKDQRTNDDIRRRAGEEPELRARAAHLQERYDETSEQVESLEDELDQKDQTVERLKAELNILKNEITRLNVELNDAQTKFERSQKSEGSQNNHEMIYRCQWRPEGGNDPCEGLFVSVEELQAHLFTRGHLQP